MEPSTGGYVAATGIAGTDVILPVRSITPVAPTELILPEEDDGKVAIALEAGISTSFWTGFICYAISFVAFVSLVVKK